MHYILDASDFTLAEDDISLRPHIFMAFPFNVEIKTSSVDSGENLTLGNDVGISDGSLIDVPDTLNLRSFFLTPIFACWH